MAVVNKFNVYTKNVKRCIYVISLLVSKGVLVLNYSSSWSILMGFFKFKFKNAGYIWCIGNK